MRAISGMCCAVECYCYVQSAARNRCQRGLARSLLLDDVKSGALQRGSNTFWCKYYTKPNAQAKRWCREREIRWLTAELKEISMRFRPVDGSRD